MRPAVANLDTRPPSGCIIGHTFESEAPSMDVAEWLSRLGLQQYAPAFRDNDIDGQHAETRDLLAPVYERVTEGFAAGRLRCRDDPRRFDGGYRVWWLNANYGINLKCNNGLKNDP